MWLSCEDGVAVGPLDTTALKLVDPFTYERTAKKTGKVVQTMTVVIAKDGRSLTLNTKGTDAQARAYSQTSIYDKQ